MKVILWILLIAAAGCNDGLLHKRDALILRQHGSIGKFGAEFTVVLHVDGSLEIRTPDGVSRTLLEGAVKLSNGNGAVLVRKVEP